MVDVGMTKREQEHHEIARTFGVGRTFTRSEFMNLYRREYPDREPGAMLPSDYCVNLSAKGTEDYPKFLRWLGRGRYELLGEANIPMRVDRHTTRQASSSDVVRILLDRGNDIFKNKGAAELDLSGNAEADKLLKDLTGNPHAFVLACIMDRQISYKRAWLIPYELGRRAGGSSFAFLKSLSKEKIIDLMASPTQLHRLGGKMMGALIHEALEKIADQYEGNPANIWNNKPSSAELVWKFLEFHGVGPKIATMAANILARDFKIPLADYYSIDISLDVHVRRVLPRLGIVANGAPDASFIYKARALNPEYPGLIDLPVWDIGQKWCRPTQPRCDDCSMTKVCPKMV
jgi:endonuclease-3